jgi:hypothetical protein
MGSRLLGFSQELFQEGSELGPDLDPAAVQAMAGASPHITELVTAISHDSTSVVGGGCDDQFEFEFALDLMLAGLERRKDTAGS